MAIPSRPLPPLLSRSRLAAWWSARDAVRSGISLADFLRGRTTRYVRRLFSLGLRLPVEVALVGTSIELRDVKPATENAPAGPTSLPPTPVATPEQELARSEGAGALEELARERARAAALEERLVLAAQDLEKRRTELAEAQVAGTAAADGERTASAHLRPTVPGIFWPSAALAVVTLLVLIETQQLSVPVMNANGLDAGDVLGELRRAPWETLGSMGFALVITCVLVLFAHVTLASGRRALDEAAPRRHIILEGVKAIASAVAVGTVAWMVGTTRHAAGEAGANLASALSGGVAGGIPTALFVFAAATIPFFSAILWEYSRDALVARTKAAAEARAFDLALGAREGTRHRLEAAVHESEAQQARLAEDRARAEGTSARLEFQGQEAQREATKARWAEGEELERAKVELRAVLEVDWYAFLKASGRAGMRGPPTPPGKPPAIVLSSPNNHALGRDEREAA